MLISHTKSPIDVFLFMFNLFIADCFPKTPGKIPDSGISRNPEMWEHLGTPQHGKHMGSIKRMFFYKA